MATISSPSTRLSVRDAYAWTADQLGLHTPQDGPGAERTVVRFEAPLEEVDFLAWLAAQPPSAGGYWSDRESGFDLIGIGRADVLTGESMPDYQSLIASLRERISSSPRPLRYFGGMGFSEKPPTESMWRHFSTYRFILPRFELEHDNGKVLFACNLMAHEEPESVLEELGRLVEPTTEPPAIALPGLTERIDVPVRSKWEGDAEEVLESIKQGLYEKVVLARRTTFRGDGPFPALALLQALQQSTRHRFHFCFQPEAGVAFVGASPERLYRRDGDQLQTEALAGTRPRGENDEEDRELEVELLGSDKERREHGYVVDAIATLLEPMCSSISVEEGPTVVKLAHSQHLKTGFRATLHPGISDADLLAALHPTPAVGGQPRESALKEIERLEPFDRGWYAGPVGWLSSEAAQFAVGIRSALVDHEEVHLFAGAGLVEGSVPSSEWDETENKLDDLVRALKG